MQQMTTQLKDSYISISYKPSKTECLTMFVNGINNLSPIQKPSNQQSLKNIFKVDKWNNTANGEFHMQNKFV